MKFGKSSLVKLIAIIFIFSFVSSLKADFSIEVAGNQFKEITEVDYLDDIQLSIVASDKSDLKEDFALILSSNDGTFGPDCEAMILITPKTIKKYSPISFNYKSTSGMGLIRLQAAKEMTVTYNDEQISVPPTTEIFQIAVFDMTLDVAKEADPTRTYEAITFSSNYNALNYVPPVKITKPTSLTKASEPILLNETIDEEVEETLKAYLSSEKSVSFSQDEWARMSNYDAQNNAFTLGDLDKVEPVAYDIKITKEDIKTLPALDIYTKLDSSIEVSTAKLNNLTQTDIYSEYVSNKKVVLESTTSLDESFDLYMQSPIATLSSETTLPPYDDWSWNIDPNYCVYITERDLSESQVWDPNNIYIITDPPLIISDAKSLKIPSGTQIYYTINLEEWVNVFEVENGGILETDYEVSDNPKKNDPVSILPLTDDDVIDESVMNNMSILIKTSASPDCRIKNVITYKCRYGIYNAAELNTSISDNYVYYCEFGITSGGNNIISNNLCYGCGIQGEDGYDDYGWGIYMVPVIVPEDTDVSELNINSIEYGIYNNTILHTFGHAIKASGMIPEYQAAGLPIPNIYIEKNYTAFSSVYSYNLFNTFNLSGIYWAGLSYEPVTPINITAMPFYCPVVQNTGYVLDEEGSWNIYLNPSSDFVHQVRYDDYLNVINLVKTDYYNIYSSSAIEGDVPSRCGAIGRHYYTDFTGTIKATSCDIAPAIRDYVVDQQDLDFLMSYYSQVVPTYTEIDYEKADPNVLGNFVKDYNIDLQDFALFSSHWQCSADPNIISEPNEADYDLDGDLWVDLDDLSIFVTNFGYEIPTKTFIHDYADPNLVRADINGDFVVDDLDRDLLIAEMGQGLVSSEVPNITASFRSLTEPNYPDDLLSWSNLKGSVEVEIEPISDVHTIEVMLQRNRIGKISYFDDGEHFNKFRIKTQNYKPGEYELEFSLHYNDGSISQIKQVVNFTNNKLHSIDIPTVLDEDTYRLQFCNGTESTLLQVFDLQTQELLHENIYEGYNVDVLLDPDFNGADRVVFHLEALDPEPIETMLLEGVTTMSSSGNYKDPDTEKDTRKKRKKRKKREGEDDDNFELLISIPDESLERFVDDIMEFIIDACYIGDDPNEANCVVPYVIYDGVEFNWDDFEEGVKSNDMKYWINFSHGEYDEVRGRTYTVIWKNIPGTEEYYPTRLYSFRFPTNSMTDALLAEKYCYMSDLGLENSPKLQFIYNFACKSGKTLHQYGNNYNDFADACGVYSTYYSNYQAYFGFNDNFVAYDGIGDYIELLTRAEEFHKRFFINLKLRVSFNSALGLTVGDSGKAVRELIQGYDIEWDFPYDESKDPIYQDSLRIYPWTDLNMIHFN